MYQIKIILKRKIRAKKVKVLIFSMHYLIFFCIFFFIVV